jgi:hypothetical protein
MERLSVRIIVDIVHRLRAGQSVRAVCRELRHSRRTIRRYRKLAAAVLAADTSVVQSDGRLALCSQQTPGEHGLRQQRPAESERATGEFPDGAQDISSRRQEARNGTHEGKDGTDSARKETARDCSDGVTGTHRSQHVLARLLSTPSSRTGEALLGGSTSA